MRNTLIVLLGSSLLLSNTVRSEDVLADANQNFGPARQASDQPVAVEQPATSTNAPSVAPAPASRRTATPPSSPVASNPEAAQVARDETIRREALQTHARILIDEGYKQYYAGKYDLAVVKLEEAVKILPRARATEIDYSRAIRALGDSYTQLAEKAFRANDHTTALDDAKKAISYDPSNHSAENVIIEVRQADRDAQQLKLHPAPPPEGPRPDRDPAFEAKREEIRKLFREGKILLNSGQFDLAEKHFEQILLLDPYNEDAQELLREVTEARRPSTVAGVTAFREDQMWEVDKAWLPPIGSEVSLPAANTTATLLSGSDANKAIVEKLNHIIFPEIKFREASLCDVVQYLSDESRTLDKSGVGVNIVLGPGVTSASSPDASAPGGAPAPAAPDAGAPAPTPAGGGCGGRPITLSLKNVPMLEALRYVTSLANLKYRVEASAVLILPLDAPDQDMVTKTYPVTPGVFTKFANSPTGGGAGAGVGGGGGGDTVTLGTGVSAATVNVDLKALFQGAGVNFPTGSSITLNDKTSTVILHNTPENIEHFEEVLPTFDAIPLQVEIEAKFIEIQQSDLDELGFDWSVGQYSFGSFAANGGPPSTLFGTSSANPSANPDITTGLRNSSGIAGDAITAALGGSAAAQTTPGQVATIQGILTNPQFQLVISALSQKTSTDVLSAPKITTLSGVQAQIKVVDEFIYPSEYSEPQVAAGGAGAIGAVAAPAAITPSIPTSFKTREVGVILNVTPTVGADHYTINLALTPEVSEFLGFLDYSPGNVTSGGTVSGSNVIAGSSVPFKIQQPLFSTRSLATSVVIWDGQTVVLGGLIKHTVSKIDDKVPFLGDLPLIGRLFRSKVTSSSKDNLLIFVTARLIDPAGNPIHKPTTRGMH